MPFPNFAGKRAEDAFFSPADFIAYKRAQGELPVIPNVGGWRFLIPLSAPSWARR